MADGALLNRYWDDVPAPRDESWAEDVALAAAAPDRVPQELWRDLRAAAESGWDFSSRWLGEDRSLASIRTTRILPVDLNSLLYKLEITIARACGLAHRPDCNREMLAQAGSRKAVMLRVMWSDRENAFVDYDWRNRRSLTQVTAATDTGRSARRRSARRALTPAPGREGRPASSRRCPAPTAGRRRS
jgi:alpha,alpha-trehalase